MMDKILYPNHPVHCIITGSTCSGKSMFQAKLISNNIKEFDKIYIYQPSLHQDLYQKVIKCFNKYMSIHIIPNFFNEEDIHLVVDEVVNNKDFEKSDTEIEAYESIEELQFPQEFDDGGIKKLDDLKEKEMNDHRVQAMFKVSRHNKLSIFIISQDYYELPKKTTRTNGNIYHIFKPNNFRDVLNICQDKSSMDMTLNEIKSITSTC